MISKRSDSLRILDILNECEIVENVLQKGDAYFQNDVHVKRSILHALQVIGECAHSISDDLKKNNPDIPWLQMEKIRHLIVHHYYNLRWDIVWETAKNDIPSLKEKLLKLKL